MNKDPIDEMSTLPGWDDLVAAGTVAPADQQVVDHARTAVRRAAAGEAAASAAIVLPKRKRLRTVMVSGAAAAAVGIAVILAVTPSSRPPAASSPPETASPTTAVASRPVRPPSSCVESYTLNNLSRRAFAFDGTIERITAASPTAGPVLPEYVSATFVVNEWFRGGSDTRVTITMPGSGDRFDPTLVYEIGSRLLVSGEPRWGGEPLDDPVAWSCGGFTRPYDGATAADWQSVLSK